MPREQTPTRPTRVRAQGITRPQPQPALTTAPVENPDEEKVVLYTPDQAANLLQIRASWLRRKAAARAIPCRYVGKHLRFTRSDLLAIADQSAQGGPARR
ncbi:helix-turn-helix domain-containing protein [Kibdelosporangium lantanae]|uniref:Helix-turn-helix domain-containing protein n=1 Tax=Kibdelosporangium lantanae TaxID=1497396 RepID=A0ABW3M629_9PSEU